MRKSRLQHLCSLIGYLITAALFASGVLGQGRSFTIQLEAFSRQEAAVQRLGELRQGGVEAYLVRSEIAGKGTLWRVRIGRFGSATAARRRALQLQERGLTSDFFVTLWEPPFSPPSGGAANSATLPKPAPAVAARSVTGAGNASPPAAAARPVDNPTPNSVTTPVVPAGNLVRNYVRFADRVAGYEFDRPQGWDGGPLGVQQTTEQNINAGALFRSARDNAFLNVIWNPLDQANNPDHDNNLIVDLILRSMRSGQGTRELKETARQVVTENGLIKTFLDLQARFESPGLSSGLDFSGKAVIVRGRRGILLVVTFYARTAPADVPTVAERIMASVSLP